MLHDYQHRPRMSSSISWSMVNSLAGGGGGMLTAAASRPDRRTSLRTSGSADQCVNTKSCTEWKTALPEPTFTRVTRQTVHADVGRRRRISPPLLQGRGMLRRSAAPSPLAPLRRGLGSREHIPGGLLESPNPRLNKGGTSENSSNLSSGRRPMSKSVEVHDLMHDAPRRRMRNTTAHPY